MAWVMSLSTAVCSPVSRAAATPPSGRAARQDGAVMSGAQRIDGAHDAYRAAVSITVAGASA